MVVGGYLEQTTERESGQKNRQMGHRKGYQMHISDLFTVIYSLQKHCGERLAYERGLESCFKKVEVRFSCSQKHLYDYCNNAVLAIVLVYYCLCSKDSL